MTYYRAFETRQLPVARVVVYRGPFMSEDRSFDLSTALFHVTMYRQFARKVGTIVNSALIRYYLPRSELSIALLSRNQGNERLVLSNYLHLALCLWEPTITRAAYIHT